MVYNAQKSASYEVICMIKRFLGVLIILVIISAPVAVAAAETAFVQSDAVVSDLYVNTTLITTLSGAGTKASPYLITSAAELAYMRDCVNSGAIINGSKASIAARTAYYTLTNNIDISPYSSWIPIGATAANGFSGVFDGGGMTVSELAITAASGAYNALFGCVNGGTIMNLTVVGTVTGDSAACPADIRFGGVVAELANGTIDNCRSAVTVTALYNSDKNIYVGGIAAYIADESIVTGCVNEGALTIDSTAVLTSGMLYIGGITGSAAVNTSKISRCQNEAGITVLCAYHPSGRFAGGIAGRNCAALEDCENRGNIAMTAIDGFKAYAGGIAGYIIHAPSVVNCNAAADITVSEGTKYVGGITGFLQNSTLDNCCFSGLISAPSLPAAPDSNNAVGGIAGYLGAATTIINCYFRQQSNLLAVNYASKTGCVFANLGAFADAAGALVPVKYAADNTSTLTSVPLYSDLLTALNAERGSRLEWTQTTGAYPALFADAEPEHPDGPTVIRSGDSVTVYGNGHYIRVSGDGAATVVEWSDTADGVRTALGSFAGDVYVYGGGEGDVAGDTYITMTGGTAALLCGGGTVGTVGGTAHISIEGGSAGTVLGGADASVISMSGGTAGYIGGAAVDLRGEPVITTGIDLSTVSGGRVNITGALGDTAAVKLINASAAPGAVLARASSETYMDSTPFTAFAPDATELTVIKSGTDIVVTSAVSVSVSSDHVSVSPVTAVCGVDWHGILTADAGYILPAAISISAGGSALPPEAYAYTAPTGAITVYAAYVTGDIVVTAQPQTAAYTVTLDPCGGTGGSTAVDAAYGAMLPRITPPSRIGFSFAGYYDDPAAGVLYYNEDGTGARAWDKTAGGTLYARWSLLPAAAPILTGQSSAALTYGYDAPPALTVTITGADTVNFDYAYEWYNGAAAGSGAITGASASSYTIPSGLDAGVYRYIVRVTVTNKAGGETSYGDFTFAVTVEPKSVTPSLSASDKVYDGTTDADGVITLSGVLDGDDVSAEGEIRFEDVNAGADKTVTASSIMLTGTKASNYTLSSDTATAEAEITPRDVTLVWHGAENRVYDARPSLVMASAAGVLAGDACGVAVTGGDAVRAGTHTATASLDNANYAIKGGNTKDYTITPAVLTAAYPGETVVFMDEPPALTVSVTGFVGGETAETAVGYTAPFIAPLTEEQKSVGEHVLAPTGGSAADYTFIMVPGTLTVAARDFDMVSVTGYDGEYDGSRHSVTFTDTKPEINRARITYYSDASLTSPTEQPFFTDAGSYTVYYKITAEGTNALSGSATVTIRRKPVTASLSAQDKVYDGTTDAVGTLSLAGIVGDDDVGASGRIMFDNPGAGGRSSVTAADIVLTGASAGNYVLTSDTAAATASINPREVALLWSGADTRAYDGQRSRVAATASGVLDGDECGVNVSGGDAVYPGAYTATAVSLTNANYTLPPSGTTRTYIITEGAIEDVAATPYIGAADGRSHPAVASLAGIMPGDGVFYSTDGGASWSDAVPAVITPGEYYVLIKITRRYCCDCFILITAAVDESPQRPETYLALINYAAPAPQNPVAQASPPAADGVAPSVSSGGAADDMPDAADNTTESADGDGAGALPTVVSRLLETRTHIAYITGDADGRFNPDRALTRAEAAQMFYNLLIDKNVSVGAPYSDVPGSMWCARAVNTLSALGVLRGTGVGVFAPDDIVTREQFCAMAVRFAESAGDIASPFTDVEKSRWSHDSIAAAAYFGWIRGYEDGTFRPSEKMTRAEAVAVINRMLGRSADDACIDLNADAPSVFTDVRDKSKWYYRDIVEASVYHDHTITGGREVWNSRR